MASKQRRCIRCGLLISVNELSLGSGKQPTCSCSRPATRRQSTRQTPMQNITYVSATPTIAEQLVLLSKLRSDGALTEHEFQTLKNRLMSDEKI
jgi:hypothetical protein